MTAAQAAKHLESTAAARDQKKFLRAVAKIESELREIKGELLRGYVEHDLTNRIRAAEAAFLDDKKTGSAQALGKHKIAIEKLGDEVRTKRNEAIKIRRKSQDEAYIAEQALERAVQALTATTNKPSPSSPAPPSPAPLRTRSPRGSSPDRSRDRDDDGGHLPLPGQ